MRLTRRDAIAALSAVGVAGAGGGAYVLATDEERSGSGADGPTGEAEVATMVAAAEVLYPSDVENVEAFVTQYLRGQADERPEKADAIADAAAYLDEYAGAWYDDEFAALDQAERDEALRRMNADTAEPAPSGSDVERVRYHVVNELLFALYATPTGGELVGIENPQGHPGGLATYQQGPQS